MTTLHTHYRPLTFEEVWGQNAAVDALRSAVENNSTQAFMLSGPSGCGKTTLARIAAYELQCAEPLIEIDAATHTGIEDMRKLQNIVDFQPFGERTAQAVILDEAHRLSSNAWDGLLKVVEEPPPGVYWFFCTTRPEKMPKTMQTRCMHLKLKLLDEDLLYDLVGAIAQEEGIDLPEGVQQLIARKAEGSARQALVNLAACRNVRDRGEAAEVLEELPEDAELVELFRMIARGDGDWQQAMGILDAMNGASPEGIRLQALNYFASALKRAKNERDVTYFLGIMDNFAHEYGSSEAQAQLLRSLCRCFYTIP